MRRTKSMQWVTKLRRLAKERWGDREVTAEIHLWDDGDFQVELFHTVDTQYQEYDARRIVLIYDSVTGEMREKVQIVQTEDKYTLLDIEVDDEG